MCGLHTVDYTLWMPLCVFGANSLVRTAYPKSYRQEELVRMNCVY